MAQFGLRTGCAAAALVASFAISCGPSTPDRAAGARESRGAVISDAVHGGGVPGFFFLPPMVPAATYGEFKAGLAPEVIIERLPLGSAPPVATFTASEIQTESDSHYKVNWDTRASSLEPAVAYRIRVVLRWFELGFADVDVVSSGSELRNVLTGEFIPLLDGRTLPIKFRIEPAAMRCPERPEGPCQAQDQCHVAGTCDPLTGACSNPAKPNDTGCDDGDACTRTDACQAGACTGSSPVVCEASDQCHDPGVCDTSTGVCSDPAKAEGTPCDDDDLCTLTDACRAGVCSGADPVVCELPDQCHDVNVCDPSTGFCSNPAKPDGTACADGNACTQADTCEGGACTGSSPVICIASDQCHQAGLCDPTTGVCSSPWRADGSACNDGTLCTRSDTCLGGTCVGTDEVICTASDPCHEAGTCAPATGLCSDPAKPDGTPCDDGKSCTAAATCADGNYCVAKVACEDGNACWAAGSCPDFSVCSEGGACDDGSACVPARPCLDGSACTTRCKCSDGRDGNPADACSAGVCGGAEIACLDDDACTVDRCDGSRGADGVTGCVHLPDASLAGCAPPPAPSVSVVGLTAATEGFFANQRLNFSVRLTATADRPDYELEFLLFPVVETSPGDETEYPSVPLGTWRIPLVTAGEKDYWVELEIPETLPPGAWEIAVHEYPDGVEFFPPEDAPDPLVLLIEAAPELPVLDMTALQVAQAALLVDVDSTVVDPAVYRDAPFAADLELVAQNYGATRVPVTAQLAWNGAPVPLRLWDPAQGMWVETLFVDGLDADAPRGVYLELALAEADASPIRASLEALPPGAPLPTAQIFITVNGDGSVEEAECVVDDPDAPVNCRHAGIATAILHAAPPPAPEEAAPLMMMALAATSTPEPLRYEKSWSKSIGNDWARAGIAFSGFAQLSSLGYEANARGNVPMRLLGLPEFQFVDATADAKALVDGSASIGVLVQAVGINVYSQTKTVKPVEWNLGETFPFVQKEKAFQKTVIVYVVPVTFKLGASGEIGLQGNIGAAFVAGGVAPDVASLTLSGGPYANVDGFGEGAVGVPFLSAGARVTLTLLNANLTASATGSLRLTKRLDNLKPLEITGDLNERLSYATSFLNGRVGLVVTYPTLRWCRVWRIRFPCGVRTVTAEAVLASWPGYAYDGDILNMSQDLFSIDVCQPTESCDGRCGPIDDGCRTQECTCPLGHTCGADSRCTCTPTTTCDGRCGVIDDGCGGTPDCGGCPAGQVCSANACVPSGGFAFPGLYDVQHRWGGQSGTWWNETGDSRAQDIVVHADGRVFRGGVPINNPTVGVNTVSWRMTGGNGTDGEITFLDGSTNTYIWGPGGRTGVLFEGTGIRFPGEGWLDFRGVRTCVPSTTCEGKCGTIFDGCQQLPCGGCTAPLTCGGGGVPNACGEPPCTNPGDYHDTCGTCIRRDAAPAVLLYGDSTDRSMTASCSDYPLVPPRLIEEASAEVRAGTSAISDAWVYFRDAAGAYVGDVRLNPANYGTVSRRQVFATPLAVSSVHICSWWNNATLLQLDLYGDPAACTP